MNPNITSIEDLKPYKKDVHVNFQVIEQLSIKEIDKGQKPNQKVATYRVADETAAIRLTVWNDAIDNIDIGETYELHNGYVNVFRDHAQLAAGKGGEIKPSAVTFDAVNQENDISKEKVRTKKKKATKRTPRFRNKSYSKKGYKK